MKNVNATVSPDGKKLVIEVDLTQRHGKSGSGKNLIIASTEGNQSVPGNVEIKFGLNIYTSAQ